MPLKFSSSLSTLSIWYLQSQDLNFIKENYLLTNFFLTKLTKFLNMELTNLNFDFLIKIK